MESLDAFAVREAESGQRLDKLLALRYPEQSRSYFQYLIGSGLVLVNGQPVKKRVQAKLGDEVEVRFSLTPEIDLEAEEIPLSILFEDTSILVVNKPAGMVVHPGAGNPNGTLVNAVLWHCRDLERGEETTLRPGIVHRLDKETSGIMVVAKTLHAQQRLIEQFAERLVKKRYLAVTVGVPQQLEVDAPIGRHRRDRQKFTVIASGRAAQTRFELLGYDQQLACVYAYPRTGRTHQIRVHLKEQGTAILGDKVYGSTSLNRSLGVERQMLHAETLSFEHPLTGAALNFSAPIPADMLKWTTRLKIGREGQ